jgi:hypothetical protein
MSDSGQLYMIMISSSFLLSIRTVLYIPIEFMKVFDLLHLVHLDPWML